MNPANKKTLLAINVNRKIPENYWGLERKGSPGWRIRGAMELSLSAGEVCPKYNTFSWDVSAIRCFTYAEKKRYG